MSRQAAERPSFCLVQQSTVSSSSMWTINQLFTGSHKGAIQTLKVQAKPASVSQPNPVCSSFPETDRFTQLTHLPALEATKDA